MKATLVIKEKLGKFYIGVFTTEMRREKWWKKRVPFEYFDRLLEDHLPMSYHLKLKKAAIVFPPKPTPPPLQPFDSLVQARIYISESIIKPTVEPKTIYHKQFDLPQMDLPHSNN